MRKFIIYYKNAGKLGMIHSDELADLTILNRRNIARLEPSDEFTLIPHLRARKLKRWLRTKGASEYRISEAVD